MALKIGLTGQIGTGKSTVGKFFEKEGAYVIEADQLVHELLQSDHIKKEIGKLWPLAFDKNGHIDRKKLGAQVFEDKNQLQALENIIHPPVLESIKSILRQEEASGRKRICVVIIPLLLETGLQHLFDVVILLRSEERLQIDRSTKRLGLLPEDVKSRIKRQMSQAEQEEISDYVIDNNASMLELEMQIKKLWRQLTKTVNQGG